MDDCKISHVSSKVVVETIEWLRQDYETNFEDGSGAINIHCGKLHMYLGMELDCSVEGEVQIMMPKHIDNILKVYKRAKVRIDKVFFVEV